MLHTPSYLLGISCNNENDLVLSLNRSISDLEALTLRFDPSIVVGSVTDTLMAGNASSTGSLMKK